MIKVGVIGTGGISGVHLGGYSRNPNVEIYALCDINEKNLAKRAEEYKVSRTFTDYREMLALKELDAVSVCTWNSAHAECAIAALRAGKHVLCEKPMALNTAQAQEMEKAAKESGKLLMIGFGAPLWQRLRGAQRLYRQRQFWRNLLRKGAIPAPQGLPRRLVWR